MTTAAKIGHGSLFALWNEALSPPAYGTVAEVTQITPYKLSRDAQEATHTESPDGVREFIPGLVDFGEASIEMNFIPGGESDKRIRALFLQKTLARGQVSFPTSPPKLLQLNAICTAYEPAMPLDDKMTASATFKISGKPTFVGE